MYSRYLGLSLIIKTVKPMRPAGIIIQLLLIILSAIVFGVGGFMSGFPYFFYINLYQQRNNSLRASNHDKNRHKLLRVERGLSSVRTKKENKR